jgi:hypothetical protein
VAVLGAAIIRYDGVSGDFIEGFLLLQLANATFAAGQVLYKHLVARYPSDIPQYRRFGYFFVGALLIALPGWLLLGNPQKLPSTETNGWSCCSWACWPPLGSTGGTRAAPWWMAAPWR